MQEDLHHLVKQLKKELEPAMQERHQNEAKLSPDLVNPAKDAELAALIQKEKQRSASSCDKILRSANSCLDKVARATSDAVRILNNTTHILANIFNHWTMPQDLAIIPHDESSEAAIQVCSTCGIAMQAH
jgi:hypothetical protein